MTRIRLGRRLARLLSPLLLLLAALAGGLPADAGAKGPLAPAFKGGRLARCVRAARREESPVQAPPDAPLAGDPPELLRHLLFVQALGCLAPEEQSIDWFRAHSGRGLHEIGLTRVGPRQRRTLSALRLGDFGRCSLVALRRLDGTFVPDPPPGTRWRKGDVLLVLGRVRDAAALRKELDIRT